MKSGSKLKLQIILTSLILTVIIIISEVYIIGVIEKYNAYNKLESCAEYISNYTNSDIDDKDMEKIKSEYNSKTRTVSTVLKNNILNENILEEVRVAIGADIISISDKNGNFVASTDMPDDKKLNKNFISHIGDSIYTDSEIVKSNNKIYVISATTRPDKKGMIQITYSPDKDFNDIEVSEIYAVFDILSRYNGGCYALVDKQKNIFLISSEPSLENTHVQFTKKNLEKKSGKFTSKVNGVKSIVLYKDVNVNVDNKFALVLTMPDKIVHSKRKHFIFLSVILVFITAFITYLVVRKNEKLYEVKDNE